MNEDWNGFDEDEPMFMEVAKCVAGLFTAVLLGFCTLALVRYWLE